MYGRSAVERGGGFRILVQAVGRGGGQNFNAQLQRGGQNLSAQTFGCHLWATENHC